MLNSKLTKYLFNSNRGLIMISNKNNPKLFYMSLILAILVSTLFFSYFSSSGMDLFKARNIINDEFPKTSAVYYNLTGQTIYIDDSNPNYNWSKTASENDWCTDYGTYYQIDHVLIEEGHSDLITIKNS